MYVNKVWPVGRALDYIASVTHLKNSNLKAGVSSDQKLFMYRFDPKGNQLVQLEFSARVGATLKDLDTVYVARGYRSETVLVDQYDITRYTQREIMSLCKIVYIRSHIIEIYRRKKG